MGGTFFVTRLLRCARSVADLGAAAQRSGGAFLGLVSEVVEHDKLEARVAEAAAELAAMPTRGVGMTSGCWTAPTRGGSRSSSISKRSYGLRRRKPRTSPKASRRSSRSASRASPDARSLAYLIRVLTALGQADVARELVGLFLVRAGLLHQALRLREVVVLESVANRADRVRVPLVDLDDAVLSSWNSRAAGAEFNSSVPSSMIGTASLTKRSMSSGDVGGSTSLN